MEIKIAPTEWREYSIAIENIQFRMLISGSSEECKKDEKFPDLHSHVSAELFAVTKGGVQIITDENTLILEQGDLVIVPPWVRHCMFCSTPKSEIAVWSFICEKRNRGRVCDVYKKLHRYVSGDRPLVYRDVLDLCQSSMNVLSEDSKGSEILPAIRAVELLLSISDRMRDTVSVEKSFESDRYDINRMMRLDSIIADFCAEDIRLEGIAAELYISGRQLDRIVRRRYGKSLHSVMMEKRVQAAERLLVTTDITVEEVGREVGFTSPSGFYREFTRYYGTTPAKYRKNKLKPQKSDR
ncbi:MAG: AraC family transcriptional regulator [Clostridia bacterium]|nr:AraC family transcriptional regulator [Clostridia bacterium]